MIPERGGRPTWDRPTPYGAPESVQAAGMVVAPLLAGFTITLIGLVVDASNKGIRHRDTALLLLMAAVLALLTAIQCAYSARRFAVVPDEIEAWWPGVTDAGKSGEVVRSRELRAEQLTHRWLHLWWASRFRFAYHLGIVLVLVGLAVVLVPPASADVSNVRWVAIALAVAGAVGEAVWIGAASLTADDEQRSRVALRLAAAARRLMPSYDARLRDARAALALTRFAEKVAAKEADDKLAPLLDDAARLYEAGDTAAARGRLGCFKVVLKYESERPQSGVDGVKARAWEKTVNDIAAGKVG